MLGVIPVRGGELPSGALEVVAECDGRVLLATSDDQAAAHDEVDVYDPSTNAFSSVKPMNHPRGRSGQVLLPDGRVLVAGGADTISAVNRGEIYDPASDTWTDTANDLPEQHQYLLLQTLADGKVLYFASADTLSRYR